MTRTMQTRRSRKSAPTTGGMNKPPGTVDLRKYVHQKNTEFFIRQLPLSLVREISQVSKGLVCRTCGDEGFNNAFVYCVKCLDCVVHRYCLDVLPKTSHKLVIWFCENCKPADPYTFTLPYDEPLQPHKEGPIDSALVKTIHPSNKQRRMQKKRKIVPLEAETEEDLANLNLGPNQITRCVVLGLAKCVFPNQDSESVQLDNRYPLNGSALPKDEHLQTEEEGAKSSPYGKTTFHKRKQVKERTIAALVEVENRISCPEVGTEPNNESVSPANFAPKETPVVEAEDRISCPEGGAEPNNECVSGTNFAPKETPVVEVEDRISCLKGGAEPNNECVSPTNFAPKETPVNLASGPNQIASCVEKGIFQKQFAESAELENCSLTGSAEKKRDAMSLPMETEKHKTQRTADPVEHSSCDSSCIEAALKGEVDTIPSAEEQKCDIKQFDCGLAKLVSDSSSIEKELNKKTTDNDDHVETANHMLKEENMKVGKNGIIASRSAGIENNVPYINPQYARPVLEPVWRGNFSIVQTDYDLFEGFVGHLSSKACYKVCEEAKTLPKLLSLRMQPKTDLWPKSFLEFPPSDENIAVYFFPGNTKNEGVFKQLVTGMIDEDLALRTPAKNADLLIFTSRVLPQSFWMFHGNYYLWGVFRSKRNDGALPVDAVSKNDYNRGLSERSRNEPTIDVKS